MHPTEDATPVVKMICASANQTSHQFENPNNGCNRGHVVEQPYSVIIIISLSRKFHCKSLRN